jgi:hypothetical protein
MAHAGYRTPARAITDDRFPAMAELLGLADADHARGKYERLIDICVQTQHYTVPEITVIGIFRDQRAAEVLVRVGLATAVKAHEPTPVGAELGLLPAPSARNEWLLRLEYTKTYIEWYGSILKGAAKGGRNRAAKARGEAVDSPVNNLSTHGGESVDSTTLRDLGHVPQGTPKGVPQGLPRGLPRGVPSDARASESETRSLHPRLDPELRNAEAADRKPARAATTTPALGLRVLEGGAEGSGS